MRSRIHKERGVMRASEVPGEPNSESLVELVDTREVADGTGGARSRAASTGSRRTRARPTSCACT
ncbi:hypothetical protein NKG05_05155 [Oerskovia sp. M15]